MTETRTIDRETRQMIKSENIIEQMFIDTCKALGCKVYSNGAIHTQFFRDGDDAVALLYLLREEGFDVYLTTGLLKPDLNTVALND